jgi:hypothetical protein
LGARGHRGHQVKPGGLSYGRLGTPGGQGVSGPSQGGPTPTPCAPFRLREHPVILSFNRDSPPVAVPNAARFLSLRGLVANESPFDLRSWEIAVRTEKHKKNGFIRERIVAAITV